MESKSKSVSWDMGNVDVAGAPERQDAEMDNHVHNQVDDQVDKNHPRQPFPFCPKAAGLFLGAHLAPKEHWVRLQDTRSWSARDTLR